MKRTVSFGVHIFGLTSALILASCADRNLGDPIPKDQVYYPFGIKVIGDSASARLVVLSTNFDQRFQSQQLSVLDANVLIDAVRGQLGVAGGESACEAASLPFYADSLEIEPGRQVVLSQLRLPGVGAEILAVDAGPGSVGHRIYATDRLGGSVILVERGLDDSLRCSREGDTLIRNTDCSDSFVLPSGGEDPFSLAYGFRPPDGRPYIGIGHITSTAIGGIAGVVSFYDEDDLLRQSMGMPATSSVTGIGIPAASGISGIVYTSTRAEGGALLALPLSASSDLRLVSIPYVRTSTVDLDLFAPRILDTLPLHIVTNAIGGRGLAVVSDQTSNTQRAVISLRFRRDNLNFNAGIGLALLDSEDLVITQVVEVGEELGTPFVRPQRPGEGLLVYVGDIRSDKIWIVDVTYNVPRVVGEIIGRAPRTLGDGQLISARTLDAPSGIAFFQRGTETYAFVSNFSNATLAILDVSDPLPQRHCIIARIGQNVNAEGDSEENEE